MDLRTTLRWVEHVASAVHAEHVHLTELDAAIGDGDHGVNLDRGFSAVTARLAEGSPATPGAVLALVGRTLVSSVGGASGPLYGTAFREAAKALGDETDVGAEALLTALQAGLEGIRRLGKAEPGDKTIVDAYAPALEAYEAALKDGEPLASAARRAADAAQQGARGTVPLQARKGRASYLGPRSVGHQDPGATSTQLVFAALARAVDEAVA